MLTCLLHPLSALQIELKTSTIWTALRLWTFSASLTPVILGATLSYRAQREFSIVLFFLSVGAVVAVNGAANMVNSYFKNMVSSYMQKQDSTNYKTANGTGPKSIVSGHLLQLDENLVKNRFQASLVNYAAFLYGFGMLCMLFLMVLSTAKNEFIAALFFGGLSSSFLYTGGIQLKYYILGDLLVVSTFGPLSVLFSYGVQCGEFHFGPLFLALPLTLSTEAIIHSKHLREVEEDRRAGVVSLAILLGKQGSYFLFTLLLFLPYLVFAVFATQYSLFFGLPVLSMPYAFQLERLLREKGPSRAVTFRATILNAAVGVLFILSCLMAQDIPFVDLQSQ